jgi:tetratricopeptide (TPR) repeat protein
VTVDRRRKFAACLSVILWIGEHSNAAVPNGTVERLESQINEAISHENYETAIRLAGDGLQLAPNSPELRFGRGWAYYRKNDIDSAIKDFNEVIRLQPKFARAYLLRGYAYMLKSRNDKALADFNQAIRVDPKNAAAYCDRADLEDSLLRRPDNALADYDQAIRLVPSFQRAYFNRGVHFFSRHDYKRAIADFSRAIRLMPTDLDAYAYRAYAYAKQGDRTQAFADASVAVGLGSMSDSLPRSVNLANRARAYRVLGQGEAALRISERQFD